MTAFVLGNGKGRQGLDLSRLKTIGPVYGCNALYRDFTPTVLVATDRPISQAIQESGYAKKNHFYTRDVIPGMGGHVIPEKYRGFSSGPAAVALAAESPEEQIYLLGFDLGPDQQGLFNNVYAGTEFYKPDGSPPTYTGNWVKQLASIFGDFPKKRFTHVQGPTTAEISHFTQQPNLEKLAFADFVARINNTKDQ